MMSVRNADLEVQALEALHNPTDTADTDATEATKALATATGGDLDEEFQKALSLSVAEHELKQAEIEREQQQIEAAIQLSLTAEAQRLEKIKAAAEEEVKAQKEAIAAKAEKKKAEKAQKKAEKAKKEKERLIAEETAFLSAQKAPAGAAVTKESAPIFTATKASTSSPLGTLPDLDTLAKQNKENMKRAEEEFARNRKARKEKKKAKKAAMKEKANVTEDDMLRRNNLFKKHRGLLVEKKKESRTSELTFYKEKVYKPAVEAAEAVAPKPECKTETSQEPPEDDPEQQKRNAFRHILASQFKQVEAKREAQKKEENLNLTAQWERSAQLRDTLNKQQEDAMLQQERARREQLAAFHQSIQTHGVDTSSKDW